MLLAPSEVNIGGVYIPPLLLSFIFGLLITYFVAQLLNRHGMSRYFAAPHLVFVAFVVVFTCLLDSFVFMG
ncbi:hypothetical protein JCM15519_31520 [Fundidesulfovibrio butyratiphilus]